MIRFPRNNLMSYDPEISTIIFGKVRSKMNSSTVHHAYPEDNINHLFTHAHEALTQNEAFESVKQAPKIYIIELLIIKIRTRSRTYIYY